MKYVPLVPAAAPLAGAVELIFSLSEYAPEHSRERLVPNGRVNLVIELDGRVRHVFDNSSGEPTQECRAAWLSGVHSNYITIGETDTESKLAVVQLAPGRALPLIHAPLSSFNDGVVPAIDVFGDDLLQLRQELVELEDPERIVTRLESWCAARYDAELEAPEVIRFALAALAADPGRVVLTELVAQHGSVSYRHFVELFKRHVGPTPKVMQRVLRFSRVFELLQGQESLDWAALSLELGFADQAHFIREFRAFSGYRPQRFVEAGHDRMNFFPDDPR